LINPQCPELGWRADEQREGSAASIHSIILNGHLTVLVTIMASTADLE
jgi:hypothetical protein